MTDADVSKPAADSPLKQAIDLYQEAWARWQPGQPEPSPADCLRHAPGAQRDHLRLWLEATAHHFRRRSSLSAPSPTAETLAPVDAKTWPQYPDAFATSDTRTMEMPSAALPSAPLSSESMSPIDSTTSDDQRATRSMHAPGSGSDQGPADDTHFQVTMGGETPLPADSRSDGLATPQFDGYEIVEELGRGGMGVVYRAIELSTQRTVCIKMLIGGQFASPEARRRFHLETEAGARLDHPNIVPIYRTGDAHGVPYFVMKFIEGTSLENVTREHFRGHPHEAVALIAKLCRAVHFAHARGILHRDLKPANVLIDTQGEPHITDFGLAKRIDDDTSQTRTGTIVGTPDYMSPEQASGRNDLVTVTSDVYSLGSMLFDLLTGQPPFRSATIVETLTRVAREPARIPATLNHKVSRDLETICLRCLEKDPNRRFQSAAALADELARYLRGEPIESRAISSGERLWRWCRRNPVLAALSASLLVLAVAAMIGSWIALYEINESRNDAVAKQQLAEDAQEQAKFNARIAGEQRDLALGTLHNVITAVDEMLRDRPDVADVQKKIIEGALEGLTVVYRTAEDTGLTDRTVGVGHQRMADIYEKHGNTDDAIEQHRLAVKIFESLSKANAKDDWAMWDAAISYDKLGDYALSTDAKQAKQWYLASTSLREKLAREINEPAITPVQRQHALAISAARVGGLALALGNPGEARTYFLEALEQGQFMLDASSADPQAQMQALMAVAGASALLGDVSFRLGNKEEARQYIGQALDMRRTIFARDSQSVSAARALAKSCETLADFQLQTGQVSDAEISYAEAMTLLETLFAKDTKDASVKDSLATVYYKLATTRLQLHQSSEAAAIYAKCLALRKELLDADPGDSGKQIGLMLALARCGQHTEAAAIAAQLRQQAADNAGTLFYVACGYALSAGAVAPATDASTLSDPLRAQRDQYVQQAIDALQKAVTLGYQDTVSLETDPDLGPVRDAPAFRQLLHGLNEPAETGTK
jgi:eukaryotic-like serine/threonine-protein kinase